MMKRVNQDDNELKDPATKRKGVINFKYFNGSSLKARVLSRVFSEDFEKVKNYHTILDPRGLIAHGWSKIFLAACLVSLFVDPLFFFIPAVQPEICLETGLPLEVILSIIRSATDLIFMINIFVHFRTAYVAPSSRVFGRGELVIDSWKIALRYITKGFWIHLVAALPIPQVLIWGVLPNLKGSTISNLKTSLMFVIMIQYLQRLSMAYPLSMQIAKATGIVTETAWLGAAYNLMLYLLSSHVVGSCSYLLTIEREEACWRSICDQENASCNYGFFDCSGVEDGSRIAWFLTSNITRLCDPLIGNYPYGIYGDGLSVGVTSALFLNKYFYSLWFGLRSVSTTGQNLTTSIYIGENIFSTLIVMLGLLNLALLIGNMQRYLQSTTVHLEEWRLKRNDKEQWMHHRQLPRELRDCVLKYDQYKWVATEGVDEEALLKDLPKDLRRQIKRHLYFNLIRRVPLFDEMDDRMLDSICERLKPALYTDATFVVRELDPVHEMLFIVRGHLDSSTTNGGQIGFFNSCQIGPGDFCGEELLPWALDPHRNGILPLSTRTVKAISDVEAFALRAEDLEFVASRFHRLHSKKLRDKFRFHSHQWRTWAALFIQVAWRRYQKRKELAQIIDKEYGPGSFRSMKLDQIDTLVPHLGSDLAVHAASLITSIRSNRFGSDSSMASTLHKPLEPDFDHL